MVTSTSGKIYFSFIASLSFLFNFFLSETEEFSMGSQEAVCHLSDV